MIILRPTNLHWIDGSLDDTADLGAHSTARLHRLTDIGVPDDLGTPAYAQSFTLSRNQENKADFRVLQNIGKGVRTAISGPVRNGERSVVENAHKPGRVPFGGDIH